ncbi:hypothetical protein [Lentzea atacamensis]|uniref:hypothetical protein n=1 Tax=Lentzea atacamensis TaxID=531938 RepID=UPI0014753BFC|nr:hypothetical protein [Lentzea atacamensis]
MGIGTIAARGCWWTWLATTPSDPHVAEVVARLALRTLTPAEEEHAVVAVMREMTSSHIEHVAGVVVARRYGLRYAVPLERFYVLGTMISCAIDVLERQGH